MSEFTGERLIPGKVDERLWQEHMSRYAFAGRLVAGRGHVIDAGCGAGYGSRLLAGVAERVTGIDISDDAINCARENYSAPNLEFRRGDCESLPFDADAADAVVAFEVIEHIAGWRGFLLETRRVLRSSGVLVVSTPNVTYYNDSRGDAGPNPYHVHEFSLDEFREALGAVFAHVRVFEQNHAGAVVFSDVSGGSGVGAVFEAGSNDPGAANFFVAVCCSEPLGEIASFVWVPRAGNVLLERERHIGLLDDELRQKDAELAELHKEHSHLVEQFRAQQTELERSNEWAAASGRIANERAARIVELQNEVAEKVEGYEASLRHEVAEQARLRTSLSVSSDQLARAVDELSQCVDALHEAETVVEERTAWALGLQKHIDELAARLRTLERSRWVRAGRAVGAVER